MHISWSTFNIKVIWHCKYLILFNFRLEIGIKTVTSEDGVNNVSSVDAEYCKMY